MDGGFDAGTAGVVRLRLIGDPILRTPARPVRSFDDGLRDLVRTMRAAMAAHRGVGLAANQIGVDLAVFVLDCDGVTAAVANPVVDGLSEETLVELEGCLSIPGRAYATPRAASATVSGSDEYGHPVVLNGHGLLARCLQHETDHLKGRVYLDRLPGPQRRQAWADLETPAAADAGHSLLDPFRH